MITKSAFARAVFIYCVLCFAVSYFVATPVNGPVVSSNFRVKAFNPSQTFKNGCPEASIDPQDRPLEKELVDWDPKPQSVSVWNKWDGQGQVTFWFYLYANRSNLSDDELLLVQVRIDKKGLCSDYVKAGDGKDEDLDKWLIRLSETLIEGIKQKQNSARFSEV